MTSRTIGGSTTLPMFATDSAAHTGFSGHAWAMLRADSMPSAMMSVGSALANLTAPPETHPNIILGDDTHAFPLPEGNKKVR